MPPLHSPRLAAPSQALLRFLRHQTERPVSLSTLCSHARLLQHTRFVCTRGEKEEVKLLPSPRHFSRPPQWENWVDTSRTAVPSRTTAQSSGLPATRHRRHSSSSEGRPYLRRLFSSSSANSLWDFLGLRTRKQSTTTRASDLPPLASFLDDNQSPGRILKPTNELRLRCTEFDENGNVTLVNGEFKKSELIAKYGLLPRDLRKIDSSLLPHILIRPSAILLNLLHLRVLIKHNRVLVFDAYGSTDSYTQSVFMYDLEGKLRQMDARANGSLPYEFRALEAVLISVTTGLESEFEGVRDPVVRVLRELEEDIDRDKLRYLLIYSKKLGTFEQKARLVRDALDELLEADDDLAAMYLTEKAAGHGRSENEHTEVEMLLESYHKVTDEIVQASENLVSNIRNTEEIVKAILDANRNSLMLLELRFSICTLGLGAGTFLAALYGMNLKNFIEESDLGFWGISGFSALVSGIVLMYGLGRLRRVQRVSMWGESGPERGLGLAKRGIKESRVKGSDERGWSWGLGRGTATAGLGPVAEVKTGSVGRKSWFNDSAVQHQHQHQQHGHGHWHRRRRFTHPESETTTSSSANLGSTASGLGGEKPPSGAVVE